ncbi:SURF1 family protein [Microbacterium sp.]|uniref:SURF1 family cytochrome oxidase biogenesis protein n=1 Tax=Microbacterium sp. TaxID=51671 RepID=UPI0039E6C1EF
MNRRAALRWSGYVVVAIAFAIACAYLSNWQFTRNADREHQLALIAANYDADPVPLADLVTTTSAFDDGDQWRPVTLVGEYLTDQTLLVRNRAHGGTSTFEVLVPFRGADGTVFIVDRGWLMPGERQNDPDVVPAAPAGQVTVVARLKPGEPLPSSGRTAPEGQVPTINLPLVADTIGEPDTITTAYGWLVSEDPAPATAPNPMESPSEDPGPHLSYAIQWILFAVMGFVFIWYMIRTELRHRREDAEDAAATAADIEGAAASPPTRRTRDARPRDRDMRDEDALLDELTPGPR